MLRTSVLFTTVTAALLAAAPEGASQTPDPLYRMMQHASPGVSLADYQAAQSMGYAAWLAQQIDYTTIDDAQFEADIDNLWTTLAKSPFELHDGYGPGGLLGDDDVPRTELRHAAFHRALDSPRRLRERMVEFWVDHFNIDNEAREGIWLYTPFHRDVMRPHALGSFRALAHAVSESGAMMEYLNNDSSTKDGPNENYARELMELHMMGTDPQEYDEEDVVELAKILTGWSKINNKTRLDYGEFKYKKADHSDGDKEFLGQTISYVYNQPTEGREAIDLMVDYRPTNLDPKTCVQFIARKMASRLLVPDPPQSIVDAAATAFGADGDIQAMVGAILAESNWSHVDVVDQRSYMRPNKYVVSLARALLTSVPALHVRELESWSTDLGFEVHHYPPPNGYPDSVFAWGGDQPGRWAFAWALTHGALPGPHLKPDVDALFAQVGGFDLNSAGQQVSQLLAAGNLSTSDTNLIQAFALSPKPLGYTSTDLKQDLLFLGAVSPSYSNY